MDPVLEACRVLKQVLQARAPFDTGNLFRNGIRIVENKVIIGGELAPYAVYTNEPWTSEKWDGKKNPNEGWVQRAIREALPLVQRVLEGKATEDDVKEARRRYQRIINDRDRRMVERLKQEKEKI